MIPVVMRLHILSLSASFIISSYFPCSWQAMQQVYCFKKIISDLSMSAYAAQQNVTTHCYLAMSFVFCPVGCYGWTDFGLLTVIPDVLCACRMWIALFWLRNLTYLMAVLT